MSQNEQSNIAMNIPLVIRFEGELKVSDLKSALEQILDRFVSLRTAYCTTESAGLAQKICPLEGHGAVKLDWRIENTEGMSEDQIERLKDAEVLIELVY